MKFVPQRLRVPVALNGLAFFTSSILSATAPASEDPALPAELDEIVVTAQRRSENLQRVPVSIQVLDTKKLEELHITNFDGYVKYLPSLSSQTTGPSREQLFIRGVTNGTDGLHVGSQPSMALYLDEQPVTTIGDNLDVHIYDIACVEELSGPQGTLFGASSMTVGTLGIITKKPSTADFEARYHLDASMITAWSPGDIVEGYVNLPVSDRAAIRMVGFTEHDGGYINNVLGPSEVYLTSGVARSNATLVKKHFNDVDTNGGRDARCAPLVTSRIRSRIRFSRAISWR